MTTQSQRSDKIIPRDLFFNLIGALSRLDGKIVFNADGMRWAEKLIQNSKDSHPTPSAPEYTLEEVIKIDKQIRHAQQVAAAQARNQTLDEIIKLAECGKCPFPKKKVIVCESTNDFECIPCLANSLRREVPE